MPKIAATEMQPADGDLKAQGALPPSRASLIASYLMCVLCGTIWGFVFEKSRVFEVRSIRGQMVFERWVMLKMFMGAMGLSAFALSYTALKKPQAFKELREKVSFKVHVTASILRDL